jgi:uncharacterized membrane protein
MIMQRGGRPSPRWELMRRPPHVTLPTIPPTYIHVPRRISIWGNDVHGDCVTAEEAFAKACNNPEIFITDNEVLTWAENHGWLGGATLIEVLQKMQTGGFTQDNHTYDDGQIYTVNWTDALNLHSAMSWTSQNWGCGRPT